MDKANSKLIIAAFALLALMYFYGWQHGGDMLFAAGSDDPSPQIAP